MTLVYPEFEILKRLYPTVGFRLLKPAFQTDDCVRGNMLISNQVHSEYKFKGSDEQDLYHNILRAQHFIEQRNPKVLTSTVSPATSDPSEVEEKETDSKVWVVSDELVERYRAPLADVQSYLDRGFVAGRRNFAAWVDKDKIAAWTKRCKQNQLDKLQALAKPARVEGVDLRKGSRLLFNKKTNERKRFPAHQIESKLSEGWTFSDLTAQRLAKVNVGAGRGKHFVGKKWVINIKTRAKQCIPAEQAAALVKNGLHSYCGARTK